MTDERTPPERFSLRRWSTRKLQAARAAETPPAPVEAPAAVVASPVASVPAGTPEAAATAELPPIETLTFDSDFRVFLSTNVAEPLKRQALKKLFADPRFNVMDGLDVYIDDYSIPSPLEPELVSQLMHARFTLDPPATRINAQGHVEDVPPEEAVEPDAPGEQSAATDHAPSPIASDTLIPAPAIDQGSTPAPVSVAPHLEAK